MAILTVCCIINFVLFTVGALFGMKCKKEVSNSPHQKTNAMLGRKMEYVNISQNEAYGVVNQTVIDTVENVAYSRI